MFILIKKISDLFVSDDAGDIVRAMDMTFFDILFIVKHYLN